MYHLMAGRHTDRISARVFVLNFDEIATSLVAKQIELYHDKVHLMSFKMHTINTL